jgi:hypothetical protein
MRDLFYPNCILSVLAVSRTSIANATELALPTLTKFG